MLARRTLAAFLLLALCGACQEEPTATPVPEAPAWLSPIADGIDQARFEFQVQGWFRNRGIEVRSIATGLAEKGGQRRRFDLVALTEHCAALDPADWEAAIEQRLGPLLRASESWQDWTPPPFELARPRLRIRIYPDSLVQAAGMSPEQIVHRVDLEGTLSCAVLDDADTALLLPRTALSEWERDADQILGLAVDNTRSALADRLTLGEREVGEYGVLREIAGDSYYASAAALWLEAWPELLGEHGAFVAIPWRHSVLVLPFDDARAAYAVPGLYALAKAVATDERASVSPDIWWRRPDAGFEAIQIEDVDGQTSALPPPGLAELLRKLVKR